MMRELDDETNLLAEELSHNSSTFDNNKLKRDIYILCREGLLDQLFSRLKLAETQIGVGRLKQLLNEKYKYHLDECAPLLTAAKEGHAEVCDLLIHEYQVDIETEGTIIFDGFKIEGATPLWCSAGANNTTIVMMLIKFGADVNHATYSRSTPLRAACFDGRVEMVKLLLDHKADFNIANKFENSCLMIASYKGHKDVVTCLLEHGAPPNTQALCGNTALQFSAERGNIEIIQILIEKGADIHTVNKNGMTAIISAAERIQPEAVEYLLENAGYSRSLKIAALEVLGASFANDKDSYDLERCYHYLKMAMEWRYREPVEEKILSTPVPAYENRIECRTMEELQQIKYNANALQMEGLAIRERVLGTKNTEVPHQVTFRGAVFADSANYDRSLELWSHALSLREENGSCLLKDLIRFEQLFCQMLHIGVHIPDDVLVRVMKATVLQLELMSKRDREDTRRQRDDEHEFILTPLYLLVVVTKVLERCKLETKTELYRLVHRMNRTRCTTYEGNTLLHWAVNGYTPVHDFHTRNICRFPCAVTASLLMECGANVNAVNNAGETPLHLIVSYKKPLIDFFSLHPIVLKLLEYGAHPDFANAKGESPFEIADSNVIKVVLRAQSQIKLKCIAAKAIRQYQLEYRGIVPRELSIFIEMHGPRSIKSNVE